MNRNDGVAFLLVLLLILPLSAWSGWVVSTLWGWFVVPLGVVSIGVWHAAGLSLLVSFLKPNKRTKNEDALELLVYSVFSALATGLLALGLGVLFRSLAS